ncbi:MAG: YbaK/EbsC family protein, partial [Pauljensenia sp.]
ADVNHVVKKTLDVRKASFWPQEHAVEASGMEYGGITPVGVPAQWRLLIDERVAVGWSCIGSGLRRSKLFVTGDLLVALPGAEVVEGLAVPA